MATIGIYFLFSFFLSSKVLLLLLRILFSIMWVLSIQAATTSIDSICLVQLWMTQKKVKPHLLVCISHEYGTNQHYHTSFSSSEFDIEQIILQLNAYLRDFLRFFMVLAIFDTIQFFYILSQKNHFDNFQFFFLIV